MQQNGQHHSGEETLREMVRGLHNKMDDNAKKTDRITNVLFGDRGAEIDGLVHTVKKHGKYISTDKKMKWVGMGLLGAGGTGLGFWDSIKHFFGLH